MALSALAGYGSDDDSNTSDEDSKVVNTQQPLKKLIGAKKEKGVVQISIPKYTKDDELLSDDDGIGSGLKKPVIKSGTGLTALLPQPKRTKRTTSLIPPSIKKPRKTYTPKETGEEDNDIVTSSGSFFSNLDNTDPPLLPSTEPSRISLPLPPSITATTVEGSAPNQPGSAPNQPYTYASLNLTHTHQYSDQPTYHHGNQPSYQQHTGQPSPSYDATLTLPHYSSEEQQPSTDNNKDDLTLDKATFRRLAGGGSKRGRHRGIEEESLMNITDISQNDIKDAVAYKKHLTEGHSHTSGTVPEDLAFSSTQKRKHQIQWLAAQAKTKEQELKNFWSQAASTRRQTQMKYGF